MGSTIEHRASKPPTSRRGTVGESSRSQSFLNTTSGQQHQQQSQTFFAAFETPALSSHSLNAEPPSRNSTVSRQSSGSTTGAPQTLFANMLQRPEPSGREAPTLAAPAARLPASRSNSVSVARPVLAGSNARPTLSSGNKPLLSSNAARGSSAATLLDSRRASNSGGAGTGSTALGLELNGGQQGQQANGSSAVNNPVEYPPLDLLKTRIAESKTLQKLASGSKLGSNPSIRNAPSKPVRSSSFKPTSGLSSRRSSRGNVTTSSSVHVMPPGSRANTGVPSVYGDLASMAGTTSVNFRETQSSYYHPTSTSTPRTSTAGSPPASTNAATFASTPPLPSGVSRTRPQKRSSTHTSRRRPSSPGGSFSSQSSSVSSHARYTSSSSIAEGHGRPGTRRPENGNRKPKSSSRKYSMSSATSSSLSNAISSSSNAISSIRTSQASSVAERGRVHTHHRSTAVAQSRPQTRSRTRSRSRNRGRQHSSSSSTSSRTLGAPDDAYGYGLPPLPPRGPTGPYGPYAAFPHMGGVSAAAGGPSRVTKITYADGPVLSRKLLDMVNTQLRDLTLTNKTQRARVTALESELSTYAEKLHALKTQLRTQSLAHATEVARLRTQLRDLGDKMQTREAALKKHYRAKIRRLELELFAAKLAATRDKQRLAEQASEAETARAQAEKRRIDDRERTVRALAADLGALDTVLKRQQELAKSKEKLERIERLEKERNKMTNDYLRQLLQKVDIVTRNTSDSDAPVNVGIDVAALA